MTACVRSPPSLRNVADPLPERGTEISRKTVRFRWNSFGPMCAAEIRRRRVNRRRALPRWRRHPDGVFVSLDRILHEP